MGLSQHDLELQLGGQQHWSSVHMAPLCQDTPGPCTWLPHARTHQVRAHGSAMPGHTSSALSSLMSNLPLKTHHETTQQISGSKLRGPAGT